MILSSSVMPNQGYEIRPIDLRAPTWGPQVTQLMTKAFGSCFSSQEMIATTNTDTLMGKASLHLAAIENERVIGFNSFTAHELICDEELVLAFQSGYSATDPEHRGRGIFVNIIETAKTLLRKEGAAFIFGWPNPNSRTILTKRLGFQERATVKRLIILTPLASTMGCYCRWRRCQSYDVPSGYQQNDHQLLRLKSKKYRDRLEAWNFEENLVWGVIRTERKKGVPVRIFDTGGLVIHNPHLLHGFIRGFAQNLLGRGVLFWRVSGESTNAYFDYLNRARELEAPEPFIIFDFDQRTDSSTRFDFFAGIKDVY